MNSFFNTYFFLLQLTLQYYSSYVKEINVTSQMIKSRELNGNEWQADGSATISDPRITPFLIVIIPCYSTLDHYYVRSDMWRTTKKDEKRWSVFKKIVG